MISTAAAAKAQQILIEKPRRSRPGPSGLGEVCQRCLAEKLLGVHDDNRGGTPLAPLLGTAFHAYAEQKEREADRADKVLVEHWITLPGLDDQWGDIRGVVDRFDIEEAHVLDWKVLGKKKIHGFRTAYLGADGTTKPNRYATALQQYWVQLQIYGLGMEKQGYEVRHLSLLLIPRDATTETVEDNMVELEFDYRHDVATAALDRAASLLKWAREHPDDLATLDSDPECYYCKFKRVRNGLFG